MQGISAPNPAGARTRISVPGGPPPAHQDLFGPWPGRHRRHAACQVHYALANRDAQGRLRLGSWASYDGDPLLTWTALPIADGWVLDGAALR